ncbi:hypothetical protein JAAARDRAFT_65765 [Jaapia argillacea MUCL 33604]|uniref:Uncharacterized protein n=1 Tax=Jaapia argillacea MUCL 33604 TaxID=933084 RepID=A0A067Q9N3_9AGAM|nr:hypothetical protein JAAARDRAFT_65765 [Jaapia argillacea MUCL 33604]
MSPRPQLPSDPPSLFSTGTGSPTGSALTLSSPNIPLATSSGSASSSAVSATITASPICCGPPQPSPLVVEFATALTISDYSHYYPNIPPASFTPSYEVLGDGSLLSAPLLADIQRMQSSLVCLGALFLLFLRNVVVTVDYIRRGHVKRKHLFYVVLASQLLGPPAFLSLIIPYFRSVNCKIMNSLVVAFVESSHSLLITGVLGVKAYRCLNNSRAVLVVLSIFQACSVVVSSFHIARLQAVRELAGGCGTTSARRLQILAYFIYFVEALFISCCFFRAIWKASRAPASQGRLTLGPSTANPREAPPDEDGPELRMSRRGWWDYVPDVPSSTAPDPSYTLGSGHTQSRFRDMWERFRSIFSSSELPPSFAFQRKSSIPGPYPIPQPPRTPIPRQGLTPPNAIHPEQPSSNPHRFAKLIPRMRLFQAVMRDELCYTAFITLSCATSVILDVIGTRFGNVWGPNGWIVLNWALMSLLVVHSFGRVVRRHEREAILMHPASWDRVLRNERSVQQILCEDRQDRWRRADSVQCGRRPARQTALRFDSYPDSLACTKEAEVPAEEPAPFPWDDLSGSLLSVSTSKTRAGETRDSPKASQFQAKEPPSPHEMLEPTSLDRRDSTGSRARTLSSTPTAVGRPSQESPSYRTRRNSLGHDCVS